MLLHSARSGGGVTRIVDLRPLLRSMLLDRPEGTAFGAMRCHYAILVEVATHAAHSAGGDLAQLPRRSARRARSVALRGPLPPAIRDIEDEHALASAPAAGADYLVTGDEDLLVLAVDARLASLRIVGVRAFLDTLAGS